MDFTVRRYQEGFAAGSRVRSAHVGQDRVPPTSIPLPLPPPAAATTFEEFVKKELHPLDAFPRLLACAESNTPPDAADRFRLQWFGLTYLGPEKDGFRLRLRVPGRTLRTSQLREAARIAQDCASGSLEINSYGGLDLETLAVPDAPEAILRAEAVGLSGQGTSGDQVVAVLASPLAGLDLDEAIDVGPFVDRLIECLLQGREFADLPHPCVVVFRGSEHIDADKLPVGDIRLTAQTRTVATGNKCTCSFRLEVAPLGDLETALRPDQAVHSCLELLRLYNQQADRSARESTTLPAFYAPWNKHHCLETLEKRLGTKLPREGTFHINSQQLSSRWSHYSNAEELRVWQQKGSGLSIVEVKGLPPTLLSAQWEEIAHLTDTLGCGRLRLGRSGTVFLPGVLPINVGHLQEELRKITSARQIGSR